MAVAVALSGLRRIVAFVVETPQLKVDLVQRAAGHQLFALRLRPGRADCPASTEKWFYDARLQEADN